MPGTRRSIERSIFLAILIAATVVAAAWALATGVDGIPVWIPALLALVVVSLLAWLLPVRLLRPIGSLTNVLGAVQGQERGIRARADRAGVTEDLAREINRLADNVHLHGLATRQSDALLAKLLGEVNLPIYMFDAHWRVVSANPAAESLCGMSLEPGLSIETIGLKQLVDQHSKSPVWVELPGGSGRFLIRCRPFRLGGRPHTLVVLAEVEAALGEERREAWQSVVRVLSHEINNSLTPIKSIAQTLLSSDHQLDADEVRECLQLVIARTASLERFVAGYAALARLPAPSRHAVALHSLATRVAELDTQMAVRTEGSPMEVEVDPDQLEQALINLVRNACDAAGESGDVLIRWSKHRQGVLICVLDNGPGPPDSENLFVPFYTTKPGGSGIGLLLARRIAELHGGWLTLRSRQDGAGCEARLWLPKQGYRQKNRHIATDD